MPNLKELSKQNWIGTGTAIEIQTGCVQRIADATEAMANNYVQLLADMEYYKKEAKWARECSDQRDRQISALRGVITKMKKAAGHE